MRGGDGVVDLGFEDAEEARLAEPLVVLGPDDQGPAGVADGAGLGRHGRCIRCVAKQYSGKKRIVRDLGFFVFYFLDSDMCCFISD